MTPSKTESSAEPKPSLNLAEVNTFDQLLRAQALRIPTEPYILYPKSGAQFEEYTVSQINNFAYRAAKKYSKAILPRTKSSSPPRTVALLGVSNLDYAVSMFALSKLGWTILFLSTRISDAAYKHLFAKTNCSDIIVQASFEKTIARIKNDFPLPLNVLPMAGKDIYDPIGTRDEQIPVEETAFDQGFDHIQETQKTLWIIHSSGSTGLPKPVGTSHRAALNTTRLISEHNMAAMITLPLYHAYGVITMAGALACGKKIAMFNANIPVTGPSMIEAMNATNLDIFYGVPYALKLLVETPGGTEVLARHKRVVFGGSSCPEELGDSLVASGVNLCSFYGTTENGVSMSSVRPAGDNDWNYLRPIPEFYDYAQWEPVTPGIYELVVKAGWLCQSLSNRPDGSYETHDLFERHPTDPAKWKYYGRLDDTLVLSNGEKANPTTLELHVKENPYVREVVVCGAQRAHLGMLIVPSGKAAGMSRDEIVENIWASTQQGNEVMPAYAKISKEMIAVLPVDQDFPRTDKGTVIRAAFYAKFADQIEKLYQDFENQNSQDGLELSEEETKEFIKKELTNVLMLDDPSQLQDDTDFFSLGLDSLGAMQIQGKIVRELKTGGRVSQNIVFEQPTLAKLAGHLYRQRIGEKDVVDSQVDLMKSLIEKYSNFPQHVPGKSNPDGDYIIITGATGSLGAHIVSQLVARDTVKKVYCLVRASSLENANQRTTQSLKERHVYDSLSQDQLAKISAFPSDLGSETLGLSSEVYEELLENVNIVLHAAWSVNFNMDVTSFEQQHIRGSYNLMRLCLHSHRATPASFNFCSSISAVLATPSPVISETEPTLLENSMPMGYARSKLITEKICAAAAHKTAMASRVLRIGQVVGDTINGLWNATEAIPLTVQSALTIGCLPRPINDEMVSWLPVDVVAQTCIDLSFIPADTVRDGVFNVSNPIITSWNNDFLPALKAAGLKFEEVTPTKWIARLKASNQDPKANPPVKLLEFFEGKYSKDTVASIPYFKTEEASKYSKSLEECKAVDKDLVGRFLKSWREQAW